MSTTPRHLRVLITDRGFARMPPVMAAEGQVHVSESPTRAEPRLRLTLPDTAAGMVELTAPEAWHLAEQIMVLLLGHHRGDARPDQREREADLLNGFRPEWADNRDIMPDMTCGRPWVAEVAPCHRCGRPASEHPRRAQ